MLLEERLRRAAGSADELGTVLMDPAEEVLLALLDNPRLTEDHLKVLLSRKSLSQAFLRELGAREHLLRFHSIKLALVRHPHAPRSVSLALARHLYLFELVGLAATPSVPVELRRIAEEAVVTRLPALTLGERLTLARSGTPRIAAALLGDAEARVFRTALENRRLTEEGVVRTLREAKLSPEAVEAIATHPRWSVCYGVRLALIRHPATSLRRMLELVGQVRRHDLADLTADRGMPPERRKYLARLVQVQPVRRRAAQGRHPGASTGSSGAAGAEQVL